MISDPSVRQRRATTRLRVRLSSAGGNSYQADLELLEHPAHRRTAAVTLAFNFAAQEREDIRWYLEDYLDYPFDPAPLIAARVERRLAEIGTELFRKIFEATPRARSLWRQVSSHLGETHIAISGFDDTMHNLPWELMLDPTTGRTLATEAFALVRTPAEVSQVRHSPARSIRVLLVIARPRGTSDVRFRSVALGTVAALSVRQEVEVDVLRPATFPELSERLDEASAGGRAYDVIHFDGHGTYQDLTAEDSGQPPTHPRGYLLFEDAAGAERRVPGSDLGKLLVSAGVRLLLLNACRSGYVDAPPKAEERPVGALSQAFRSLADEVVASGVPGVVAMQYKINEGAAAHFYDHAYGALVQGSTLGKAVNQGRRAMQLQPLRQGFDTRPLRDWVIPIVYEADDRPVFARSQRRVRRSGALEARANPAELPAPPTTGFIGQDDSLLDLDRAVTTHGIVLLHGIAGSGKSATAAEFARWYSATGGAERVLYTSFERYIPAERVIDAVGRAFSSQLHDRGTDWLVLSDEERAVTASELLQGSRSLWIWDNVEGIVGFPIEGESVWTSEERLRLASLLHRLPARFLLTSRRAEDRLALNAFPIEIQPLPMTDRAALANALARELDWPSAPILAWKSLLEFSDGNPLTIRVTVGQAISERLESTRGIENFVAALRSGAAKLMDDEAEGRSRSLAASLSYGLEHAFDEPQRAILALLHLFQGFVDIIVLFWMGQPDHGVVPELAGLDRQQGEELLKRAANVGLLTRSPIGGYLIHPAVPWYFKRLFDQHYSDSPDGTDVALRATRAYAGSIGALGSYYQNLFLEGKPQSLSALKLHEANLLQARGLAMRYEWFEALIGATQGLRALYESTGRNVEWDRIVRNTVPLFVDPRTDGPLAGRSDQHWNIVTECRVQLLRRAGDLDEAERLQRLREVRLRKAAMSAMAVSPVALSDEQRIAIELLANSLGEMASIFEDRHDPACMGLLDESISLWQRIGDRTEEAKATFNLGNAATEVLSPPDLDRAEQSFKRSLLLRRPEDRIGKSKCYGGLGFVALARFRIAEDHAEPDDAVLRLANAAVDLYTRALRLTTGDDLELRATLHNQLAVIFDETGDPLKAQEQLRRSIRYEEAIGDVLAVAKARHNMALAIGNSRRFSDALLWAKHALSDYQQLGERASKDAAEVSRLIAEIEELVKEDAGG